MSSIPRCDAASISTTSREVPLAIVTQALQTLSGLGVGPCTQFSPFARMRASEVFPVPRGPAKRYAWRTWPDEIAFFSVRTIASWPTTSSKSCGRYFRYSAATEAILLAGSARLDRPREGVALGRLAGLVAPREPAAALLGGAVRPGLRVDLALGLLL